VKLDFEIFFYQVVFSLSHMLVSEFGVNANLSTSLRKVKLDFEIFVNVFFFQVVFSLSHMLVSEFGVNASLSTSLSKVKLDFEIYLNVLPKNGKIFYHPKFFKNQNFFKKFWYSHKLDHKLRPLCNNTFFLNSKHLRAKAV
jgi:hypothetical protein